MKTYFLLLNTLKELHIQFNTDNIEMRKWTFICCIANMALFSTEIIINFVKKYPRYLKTPSIAKTVNYSTCTLHNTIYIYINSYNNRLKE